MKIDDNFVKEFISIIDKHEITPLQMKGVFERAGYNPKIEPSSREQSFINFFQPLIGVDVKSEDFKNITDEIRSIPKHVKPGLKMITPAEIDIFISDIDSLIVKYS